ncbi:e8026841-231e-407d-8ab1-5ac0bd0a6985 [Sclerotinia trifoliorum]|uniref:E8026841-231e-407d-8ab1-5ac0bd0a6985 n=1 Tax=Sclerotinia trifoliorum TaxID=28548 RepID=A0A8H2W1U3_9HELO|nr:e8026841-231e-407d-8ab1-5ac0bd0a6985 [Sclerotinia trifoliorum]
MPSKQRTFELVDAPKVHRPMTSKQAKKAYQKANRTPRITKAEQKRQDAEELAKHRKAYEKEQAAAKAKAARDKKAAKALEQKEERKRLGVPEPSRHVRASQSRISMFIGRGNKRLRATENKAEDSEGTMCDELDEGPPAKRTAHDNSEDESEEEAVSKSNVLHDFEHEECCRMEQLAKNILDVKEAISKKVVVPEDSEDEFGDFPPLSDRDISLLDNSSMHSTPRPRSTGVTGPSIQKSIASFDNEQELPRMKNFEREQMSPDDPFQLENMLDCQIRSEAADAAYNPDCKQVVSFKKEQTSREDTLSMTAASNRLVEDLASKRELLWHAPINGRHGASIKFINTKPPSPHKVPIVKQKSSNPNLSVTRHQFDHPSRINFNETTTPGMNLRQNSRALDVSLPRTKKSLSIEQATSNKETPLLLRASSRMTGLGKRIFREEPVQPPMSKSHSFQRTPPQKLPVQASRSVSGTRPALRGRSINMGPSALPAKSKIGTTLAAPHNNVRTASSFDLPPSSTQAFLESHYDEFFPSPTQEARELCEEPVIPRTSTSSKTDCRHQNHREKQEDVHDDVSKISDDDFGGMLSTQELKMFSEDRKVASSPSRQGWGKESRIESFKEIPAAREDIKDLICSQDSLSLSQEPAGLESLSKVKSPITSTLQVSQAQIPNSYQHQNSTTKLQEQLAEPLCMSTPNIDPEIELTPKPRRSPWFKEKPEDRHTKKRFFTEKPEDLEAAALAESRKAWDEIKEATSSNRHNFDDDLDPDVDGLLIAALAESKEWDEVYKAVVPTPTPRKTGEKGDMGMNIEEKENQTPSRIMDKQTTRESTVTNSTRKFVRRASLASTDYGDGEVSDWDDILDRL